MRMLLVMILGINLIACSIFPPKKSDDIATSEIEKIDISSCPTGPDITNSKLIAELGISHLGRNVKLDSNLTIIELQTSSARSLYGEYSEYYKCISQEFSDDSLINIMEEMNVKIDDFFSKSNEIVSSDSKKAEKEEKLNELLKVWLKEIPEYPKEYLSKNESDKARLVKKHYPKKAISTKSISTDLVVVGGIGELSKAEVCLGGRAEVKHRVSGATLAAVKSLWSDYRRLSLGKTSPAMFMTSQLRRINRAVIDQLEGIDPEEKAIRCETNNV